MINQETLRELFIEQIRDLYDAEKQLVKALPKLAKAVQSEELSDAIRSHLEETEGHVERLEQVFEAVGVAAKGKPCKAMKGLVAEGSEATQEDKGELRDLAVIAGAQRVEHYEISAYGTARTLAEFLGLEDAVRLLQETEEEESAADEKLTEIAMSIYESAGEQEDEEQETVGAGVGARGGRSGTRSSSQKRSR